MAPLNAQPSRHTWQNWLGCPLLCHRRNRVYKAFHYIMARRLWLLLAPFFIESGLMIPRKVFLFIVPKIVITPRAICLHVSSNCEECGDCSSFCSRWLLGGWEQRGAHLLEVRRPSLISSWGWLQFIFLLTYFLSSFDPTSMYAVLLQLALEIALSVSGKKVFTYRHTHRLVCESCPE